MKPEAAIYWQRDTGELEDKGTADNPVGDGSFQPNSNYSLMVSDPSKETLSLTCVVKWKTDGIGGDEQESVQQEWEVFCKFFTLISVLY